MSKFGDIAGRVASMYAAKASKATEGPEVEERVLEAFAVGMASSGYEMTERAVEILSDYLKGYNLWLCGNVGVGKTFFFECASRVRVSMGERPISKLSMIETMGWTMDSAREWAELSADDDVLIDDVGVEPEMNSYGVRGEVFPYLLEKRMQLRGRRTHITSNLGPSDILARYDRRVSDRFVQMFKMERIDGHRSRRKLAPWRPASSIQGGAL